MIFGVVIEAAVGLACVILGLLIWIKRKLSLIHDYHFKNVKAEDVPAYARGIGLGMIAVGLGIITTGILNLFYSPYWWIPLAAGSAVGVAIIIITQRKYNGSVFS